jgi:DNA-binding MarR family transcriptional regulator
VSATRAAAANVLGALALAIADQLDTGTSPAGGSEAAALSALDQFPDTPSVSRIRDVLGLTHSGTVRLLERVAVAGLITREPGPDKRTRSVRLTARGRRVARSTAAQRAAYLDAVLNGLTPAQVRTLNHLLAKLMSEVVDLKEGGPWICRRCDLSACGRSEGDCPAAAAADRKYGSRSARVGPSSGGTRRPARLQAGDGDAER